MQQRSTVAFLFCETIAYVEFVRNPARLSSETAQTVPDDCYFKCSVFFGVGKLFDNELVEEAFGVGYDEYLGRSDLASVTILCS